MGSTSEKSQSYHFPVHLEEHEFAALSAGSVNRKPQCCTWTGDLHTNKRGMRSLHKKRFVKSTSLLLLSCFLKDFCTLDTIVRLR